MVTLRIEKSVGGQIKQFLLGYPCANFCTTQYFTFTLTHTCERLWLSPSTVIFWTSGSDMAVPTLLGTSTATCTEAPARKKV
jgi:hypothetical protein